MPKERKKKKHPPVGISMRVHRKTHKARLKKQAAAIRKQFTIKTLQKGGRIMATVDPVTGKVLKREKNPNYVPEDGEFRKLTRKQKTKQPKR